MKTLKEILWKLGDELVSGELDGNECLDKAIKDIVLLIPRDEGVTSPFSFIYKAGGIYLINDKKVSKQEYCYKWQEECRRLSKNTEYNNALKKVREIFSDKK